MKSIVLAFSMAHGSRLINRDYTGYSQDCREKIQEIHEHSSENVSNIIIKLSFLLIFSISGKSLAPEAQNNKYTRNVIVQLQKQHMMLFSALVYAYS